jgi:hypothetical protein
MHYLWQSVVIFTVVMWLHDKTPNKVLPGFLGVCLAWLLTWLLWQFKRGPR